MPIGLTPYTVLRIWSYSPSPQKIFVDLERLVADVEETLAILCKHESHAGRPNVYRQSMHAEDLSDKLERASEGGLELS